MEGCYWLAGIFDHNLKVVPEGKKTTLLLWFYSVFVM
jgi:hypothetical protein